MNESLDPNWLGNTEEDEIYKENILDHFKNPHNFGTLENFTFRNKRLNPVCGDQIELFLLLKDDKVKNSKFIGEGCAISVASASMLTDKIKGMNLDELRNLKEQEILDMIGIRLGPVRIKCGLLCLKTLFEGIAKLEEKNEQISN